MTLNGITASSVIFIARRYDSALLSILCPSVRTCLSQAGNGMVSKWLTDRAGIWHGGFLPSTLCIVKKFRQAYLPNNGTSLWNFVPNYGLGNFVTEVVQCIVNKTRRRLSLTRLTIVVASWLDGRCYMLTHCAYIVHYTCVDRKIIRAHSRLTEL